MALPPLRDHAGRVRACVCGVDGGCAYCRRVRLVLNAVDDGPDAPCHSGTAALSCGRCHSYAVQTPPEGISVP